jgi:hypothetical protein
MRRTIIFLIIVGVAEMLCVVMLVDIPPRVPPAPTTLQPGMCDNSGPVPAGWIQFTEQISPAACTSPDNKVGRFMDLWEYTKAKQFDTHTVCSDATVPLGWVVYSYSHNPQCASLPGAPQNEVMTIMKISN